MTAFYFVILVVSVITFGTEMSYRYVNNDKLFDISILDSMSDFFPKNVVMITVWLIFFSAAGITLELLGYSFILSVPCGIFAGFSACFLWQNTVYNRGRKSAGRVRGTGESAVGLTGYCTVPAVGGDGGKYGRGLIYYKDDEYEVNIIPADGKDILEWYKIIVLLEENGAYFVTTEERLYEGLDDL